MKKFFIILITILFILPFSIKAENKQDLQGVVLANPGDIVTYKIQVATDITIYGYQTELVYASDLFEFQGITAGDGWTLKSEISLSKTPIDLVFENTKGYAGKTNVATLTFKVKDNITKSSGDISLNNAKITVKDSEGGGTLTKDLVNKNLIKTISIKSTDNTLKALTVDKKSVNNFSANTYEYVVQVDSSVSVITINAVLSNNTASFVSGYGSRKVNLEYGDNKVEIKVKSEAGEIKVYTITINRFDDRGTNNNLKELIINDGKIKIPFDKDEINYRINVYKLIELEIEAFAEDTKAKVEIEKPKEIVFGDNVVKIKVISETKEEKIYTIEFNNIDTNINTTLKYLEIYLSGDEFTFNESIYDYEIAYSSKYKDGLVIKKETFLSEMDGVHIDEPLFEKTNKDLKVGSVIKLRVYADDGTETLYTFTMIKNDKVNFFFIVGLIILIILLVVFIYTYINRRKNKKEIQKLQSNIEKTIEMKL